MFLIKSVSDFALFGVVGVTLIKCLFLAFASVL